MEPHKGTGHLFLWTGRESKVITAHVNTNSRRNIELPASGRNSLVEIRVGLNERADCLVLHLPLQDSSTFGSST